jgi:hypothetical protein
MLNRLWYLPLVLFVTSARSTPAQDLAWHAREGTLPSLVTTRGDVERLVTEIIESASVLPPGVTVLGGEMMVMVMAFTRDGRGTSSTVPNATGLDTLHRYLGARSDFAQVFVQVHDARVYNVGYGPRHWPRVGDLLLALSPSADNKPNTFRVSGFDRRQVDKIADRIERFGASFATWRSPAHGAMIKSGAQVLALLLLPVALTLRDRSRAWLLYPTSAALLVASYLFPFTAVFSNLTIVGG